MSVFRTDWSSMPKSLRSQRHVHLRYLLIAERKAKGLTQQDVASRLGKPQSFVAKYEGGERRLDVIEFIDIVEAIEAVPEELIAKLRAR